MSELRDRMIRDMTVRGFAPRTHKAYIAAVVRLAKHDRRSPNEITNDEVQTYLAHLIQERKLSGSTCSQAANAIRFLYHVTLNRPRTAFHVPLPKQPQKLPRDPEPGRGVAVAYRPRPASSSPLADDRLRRGLARQRGDRAQGF